MSAPSGRPVPDHVRTALLGAAVFLPGLVAVLLVPLRDTVDPANAALVMVVAVVAVACGGDRLAGILAALSAAAWFDLVLTRPYRSLAIDARDDVVSALVLLVVGVVVAEVAGWGRRRRDEAVRATRRLAGVEAALDAMDPAAPAPTRLGTAAPHLSELLGVRSVEVVQVPPTDGAAWLGPDGRVEVDGAVCDVDRFGLPRTRPVVVAGPGGRALVMQAGIGAHPSDAQRLAAVALAGWVLTSPRSAPSPAGR